MLGDGVDIVRTRVVGSGLIVAVLERRELRQPVVDIDFHDPPSIQSVEGSRMRRPVAPLIGDFVFRRVRVRPGEVVFIKGVIEASEGLACLFAERGGELVIATSPSQKAELDLTLADLEAETGALLDTPKT